MPVARLCHLNQLLDVLFPYTIYWYFSCFLFFIFRDKRYKYHLIKCPCNHVDKCSTICIDICIESVNCLETSFRKCVFIFSYMLMTCAHIHENLQKKATYMIPEILSLKVIDQRDIPSFTSHVHCPCQSVFYNLFKH